MHTEQLDRALDQAKVQLISRPDCVFITTVLFNLRFKWSERAETTFTDGMYLLVNPDYFLSLEREHRQSLLAHAAYRVALRHGVRGRGKNFEIWKDATSFVINSMLVKSGFEPHNEWLYDPDFDDMAAEDVYDELCDRIGYTGGMAHDTFTIIIETDDETEEWLEETIKQASMLSRQKGAGDIPGEVEIYLDNLLAPKLPWYRILANILSDLAKTDYSFSRPNRRFMPDHHLPSLYSEALGEISVAVDVSGSITPAEFDQFISEIHTIHKTMKPSKTSVISFDTRISDEYTIEEARDIMGLKFYGGGGTQIEPVLSWVHERKPKAMIIFTDGCFGIPHQEIPRDVPIFWIIHGSIEFKPVRGKVIRFELDKKSCE